MKLYAAIQSNNGSFRCALYLASNILTFIVSIEAYRTIVFEASLGSLER